LYLDKKRKMWYNESMKNYRQCFLSKTIDDCFVCTTAWIPEEHAVLNKIVKIKDDGIWSDGWTVRILWSFKPKEWVEQHERDYLKQREASDI